MSSRRLAEATISLIEAHIKANIAAALADVRADHTDAKVSTEPPASYFRYQGAMGYRCPAVFTICDQMDMKNIERGANHINAAAKVIVSVLVEDRLLDLLVLKTWRYQAALHKLLHLTALTSADLKVKLELKVERIYFSPEYSDSKDQNVRSGVFRKEVAIEMEVDHIESL